MRRSVGFLAAVVAPLALTAGVALAAASPTVTTGAAKSVSDTAEALAGTVNPNGVQTGYTFQYGLTTAYGLGSASHSAGGGSRAVKASATIGGLTPGTTYHYRIAALNQAGAGFGSDRSFTTSGHPPANVSTGAPSSVRKEQATVTGTVTPNGAATTWVVQYGLTHGLRASDLRSVSRLRHHPGSGLGSDRRPGAGHPVPLPHRRLPRRDRQRRRRPDVLHRAHHPAQAPYEREHEAVGGPEVAVHVHHQRHRSTARASSPPPRGARAASRCATTRGAGASGVVATPVGSNCDFTAQNSFRPQHIGRGVVPLRITIQFGGNGYLAPAGHTNFVTAG